MSVGALFSVAGHCYVCGVPLVPGKIEYDHFPVAHALGGNTTLAACKDCHTAKDRTPLLKWDAAEAAVALVGLWAKATTQERLMLAKMFHIVSMGVHASAGNRPRKRSADSLRRVKP